MTNNPTIDGVSRELLEDLVKIASRNVRSAWGGSVCERARTLLDANHSGYADEKVAPAVERQEPIKLQHVAVAEGGNLRWMTGRKLQECELYAMPDGCAMRSPLYVEPPEVNALQSTIAQLQARVAELESGRGEPVTMDGKTTVREYVADSVPEDQIGDDWTKGYEECKRRIHRMFQQPVNANARFTAPPAPVAVVLPDFDTWYAKNVGVIGTEAHRRASLSWNACLDATAALNGERK